jgi:L-methionine (R)-S-oxide reductase
MKVLDKMEMNKKIIQILDKRISIEEKLQEICNFLQQNVAHYHWVGFYFVLGDQKKLKLAQFAGKPTEHTIIPFGKGICGQVALSNEKFIVQDVTEQDNYISCGFDVKSEIVVPIFQDGKNIGQIDIDSHSMAPFTQDDETLLEFVCQQVAKQDLSTILVQGPS